MPVTPSSLFQCRNPGRWLAGLLLLAVCCGLVAVLVSLYGVQIVQQSVIWQKTLHQQLAGLLQQVAEHRPQAGLSLIGISLLYGIVHAAGPGHGKVVITTFLATHPTRIKTSLQLTLAAALVQGGVAVALVTIMLAVLGASARQLHLGGYWLEKGCALLVVVLGISLCWQVLRHLWQHRSNGRQHYPAAPADAGCCADHHHTASPQAHGHCAHRQVAQPQEHCGCGHHHLVDASRLSSAPLSLSARLALVFSMGLRPCSGAIMLLLFARVTDLYGWGVISVLAMSAGTALTVSATALLVQFFRHLAVRLSRPTVTATWRTQVAQLVKLLGGLLLIGTGILLFLSVQPVISGGLRTLAG